MIDNRLITYSAIILHLGMGLLSSPLFAAQAHAGSHEVHGDRIVRIVLQPSRYTPPPDIGLPDRREPGGSR